MEYRVRNLEFKKDQKAGFTLLEIIITIAVLAIAAVGVLSVFATGMQGSADPLIVAQATQLAQERMEVVIGDRMSSARGFNYITPGNYGADNPVLGTSNFNRTVQVFCVAAFDLNTATTDVPPCPSGYTHVRVTVNNARIGNVTTDTIITDYNF